MKFLMPFLLSLVFLAASASANTGAAINKKTGKIKYMQGSAARAELVTRAIEACQSEAQSPRDCAPVLNKSGLCEHVRSTSANYGAFAARYEKGGWTGYVACARTTREAWELIAAACDHCAKGETFFDETDETSDN